MSRAARLAQAIQERELAGMVVTDLVNVRYLSGFTGTNAVAVVFADGRKEFITDFRYVERAEQEVVEWTRHRGKQDLLADAVGLLEPGSKVGFEEGHMTVRTHRRLQGLLPDGVELVGVHGVVEGLREVKDNGELELIRTAARIADDALTEALAGGLAGRTEAAFARALEHGMRERGAEPSFPSIVAAGPHGALPHAEPLDELIPEGVLVVVDWGARRDGYCSDCTRTFATGDIPEQAREVYELVRRAQAAAGEAIEPGIGCIQVDRLARELIEAAGHGGHFGHGLGHGVGLEVHEGPRLSPGAGEDDVLRPGSVVTVEPGVYVPGELGVRIEDLVVVSEGGSEILSSLSKDLTTV